MLQIWLMISPIDDAQLCKNKTFQTLRHAEKQEKSINSPVWNKTICYSKHS